jgi:hypothetical protein
MRLERRGPAKVRRVVERVFVRRHATHRVRRAN